MVNKKKDVNWLCKPKGYKSLQIVVKLHNGSHILNEYLTDMHGCLHNPFNVIYQKVR